MDTICDELDRNYLVFQETIGFPVIFSLLSPTELKVIYTQVKYSFY